VAARRPGLSGRFDAGLLDVADLPENRTFFQQFKERLKQRFNQIDIWVTTHPIDVV